MRPKTWNHYIWLTKKKMTEEKRRKAVYAAELGMVTVTLRTYELVLINYT